MADPKPTRQAKRYRIERGTKSSQCKKCNARIYWATIRGRSIALDLVPGVQGNEQYGTSHELTCMHNTPEKTFSTSVVNCARCGLTHAKVCFSKLTRPAKEFQWWGNCPTTGEPILLDVKEDKKA